MTSESLLIFVISLIILWIKPGPGQAFKITRTLNSGFLAGYTAALGIISACIIFFLLAAFGSKIITNFFNDVSIFLKFFGMVYLFYLGVKSLSNLKRGKWTGRTENIKTKEVIENYSAGLFLTLANPLPIFFFLGLLPTLVPIGDMQTSDIIKGIIIITMVGLIVDGLLIGLVAQVKSALADDKFIKIINLLTGLGFMMIGILLGYSMLSAETFHFDL